MKKKEEIEDDRMLYVSFNQDYSCFSIGTERGFKIYESYPFKDKYERILNGGIGFTEMLYRSNFIALMGGGKIPKYSKNKLVIWDDNQEKIISEMKFIYPIKNVKLKKDKIFIICNNKIFVFNLQTYTSIGTFDTADNPKGLFGINSDPSMTKIAFQINNNNNNEKSDKSFIMLKDYDKSMPLTIQVQDGQISFIALNYDGTLLATSNELGKEIRIHSCLDGTLLQEVRRGKEKAQINFICFDNLSNFMAATSDRGTVHIWSIEKSTKKIKERKLSTDDKANDIWNNTNTSTENKNENFNSKKSNNSLKLNELNNNNNNKLVESKSLLFKNFNLLNNLFQNENSFARIKIEEEYSICCFGPNNIIIIITAGGKYYQAQFDPINGGLCKIIKEERLYNRKK